MVCDKVRIRFQKSGDLRLVSHHDLMRCWERMLRRAPLPFHSTQGFNPKPRLVFALALGLGIVGRQEVVELELDAELPADDLLEQLRRQAPAGLQLFDIRKIDKKATAQVRRVAYRLAIPRPRADLARRRAADLLAASEIAVDRQRPTARRLNIRPYVELVRVLPEAVELQFWVTPNGTARPGELLALLGLDDLLGAGAVLERTLVELHDEVKPSAPINSLEGPGPEQQVVMPFRGEPQATELPTPAPSAFRQAQGQSPSQKGNA